MIGEAVVWVVPKGVSTKEAALAEPFGVALHTVSRSGDVAGRSVLVNGCGPIGTLAVAAAKAAGTVKAPSDFWMNQPPDS